MTPTKNGPVTAATSRFTFYDIESLANVFTVCAYTPNPHGNDGLEMFFLVDNSEAADGTLTNLGDLLARDPRLDSMIRQSNPIMPASTQIRVHDLREQSGNQRLATLIGMSDAETIGHYKEQSTFGQQYRLTCDTDKWYDPMQHPFLAGYNSQNYDTVMLARYFEEIANEDGVFTSTTAATMRAHNDALFSDHIEYMPGSLGWGTKAAKFRRSMLNSGRHLDVARLNELQFKVGLKRLLGMLGHQIKESEKLSHNTVIGTVDELIELLAYNVSDCVGLSKLFQHPAYAGNFDLKAGLLEQYPDTRFTPNGRIRKDRLTVDSSSAKFVGRILCPDGHLDDIEGVSFNYPHPKVAAETNRPVHNVLTLCREFFENNVAPDPATTPDVTDAQRRAHAQFMAVYDYYRSIEGKNFNDSDEYRTKFSQTGKPLTTYVLRDLPKTPNNVPYFDTSAEPTSCFATFSTGGIHGAEFDHLGFERDRLEYEIQVNTIGLAKKLYPDAKDFVVAAKDQHNQLRLPDGTMVDKRLVLYGSDPATVKFRKPKKGDERQNQQLTLALNSGISAVDLLATQRDDSLALTVMTPDVLALTGKVVLAEQAASKAAYREVPAKREPILFVCKRGNDDDQSTRLHPSYSHTSAALVIHEDFTSYYPNLLRNMRAFYNPNLGEDRYATIFFEKERLGKAMKQPGLSSDEKARLSTLRNGTKLILNSASGAGDAGHSTPIRMNNQIISMRIIGQLFSWLIGQAQTLKGAKIISTNTDGLYSVVDADSDSGFDIDTNNAVLKQYEPIIGVDIEPELMFLISKDSNNRLELHAPTDDVPLTEASIISAGGGTLACFNGPTPTKALAHPAVIDFALARYLQVIASRGERALSEPFDPILGSKIIHQALDRDNPIKTLQMFQNVIAASRGSITYPFAADPLGTSETGAVIADGDHNSDPKTDINLSNADDAEDTTLEVDDADESGDETSAALTNVRALQMVNRVFVVKAGTPDAVSLHNAGTWKVSDATRNKRQAQGGSGVQTPQSNKGHLIAEEILRHHGWKRKAWPTDDGLTQLPTNEELAVRRINGIDPSWSMLVVNDDLHTLSVSQVNRVLDALDLDVYVQMLDSTFTKNWMN